MTLTLVGDLTIGALIPLPVSLVITAELEVQAKLSAMIDFSLKLGLPGLSIAAQLDLCAELIVALNLCLEIGITPPTISAQLDIVLAVILQLQIELQIYIDFLDLLSARAFVYAYDGAVNQAGTELSSALVGGFPGGAPTDHANMLIFGTSIAADWAIIAQIFKTAP